MSGTIEIDKVKTYLLALQDKLCAEFEELDASRRFAEDAWERPQGAAASAGCWSAAPCLKRRG